MVEVRPRFDVAIPPEVIASVDEIGRITTGISGIIDAVIVDKERHVTTGKDDVTVISKNYVSSKEIDTIVPPGGIVTGASHIHIASFEKKTVMGKCDFDGRLIIDCSPLGIDNYFPNTYVVSISSGTVFTASFTETFDYMLVRVENTSASTGSAVVWVNLQA